MQTSKTLNILLWIAQGLLALTFIWAAYMKLLAPVAEINKMWPWTIGSEGLVKFTGMVDLLAGIGLILPALLRIQPKLTVFAAYGTVLLMIAASTFHISRGEGSQIGFNIFVAMLAVFITWGRQKKAPILPR
jgi:putative oxidoreductase